MTYYRGWIYKKNSMSNAILYFALEDDSFENIKDLYKSFDWCFRRMPRKINAVQYGYAIIRYPVTNHINCFNFKNAVVIE